MKAYMSDRGHDDIYGRGEHLGRTLRGGYSADSRAAWAVDEVSRILATVEGRTSTAQSAIRSLRVHAPICDPWNAVTATDVRAALAEALSAFLAA